MTDSGSIATPSDVAWSLLPRPARVIPVTLHDGEQLWLRQYGNPSGPRLFISHGNGLAVDLYYPYWKHFLQDFEVVVFDVRNHGWNNVGECSRHTYFTFVFDNECLLTTANEVLGAKPAFGLFHSLTALTALNHAAHVEGRWAGLVLFDPPVPPPPGHPLQMDFHRGQVAIGQRASSRQERYASYAEFEGVMRKASVFRRLNGEAVELYAAATFRPDGGGGVVLRCPRDYEAQVFLDNKVSTVALALQRLPPIAVIGGEPNDGVTDMPSRICAALFPEWGIPYECVPQTTHFLQIEQPGDCAERTLRHLQGWL